LFIFWSIYEQKKIMTSITSQEKVQGEKNTNQESGNESEKETKEKAKKKRKSPDSEEEVKGKKKPSKSIKKKENGTKPKKKTKKSKKSESKKAKEEKNGKEKSKEEKSGKGKSKKEKEEKTEKAKSKEEKTEKEKEKKTKKASNGKKRNKQTKKENWPKVGDLATYNAGTDYYGYQVTNVSKNGKEVDVCRYEDGKTKDSKKEVWVWRAYRKPEDKKKYGGAWINKGDKLRDSKHYSITFGQARNYQDPSF
jgi:hypothetical protein